MSVSGWRWWGLAVAGAVTAVAVTGVVSGAGGGSETVFVPVTPCRLVDTRPDVPDQTPTNVGPRSTPIGTTPVEFTAWHPGDGNSTCEIPNTATAISTNTTIVNPTANSYVALYPADKPWPGTSNLNFVAGQRPTPNAVTTPLSTAGRFMVLNASGTVDVIIDVVGYYQPSTSIGAAGPVGPRGSTGPIGPKGDPGVGDIGCEIGEGLVWSGTEWQCLLLSGDQQLRWDISYDGVSIDSYTGYNYATTDIPAGMRLVWDVAQTVFDGDVSACGPGGFFLLVEPEVGWGEGSDSIYALEYGVDPFNPGPTGNVWYLFHPFGSTGGMVFTDTALSWRAGCYTNLKGPVPAFNATIRFTLVPVTTSVTMNPNYS